MEDVQFFLRNSFLTISDFEYLLEDYRTITNKDYIHSNKDKIMIELLIKNNLIGNYFRLESVKLCYLPFLKIICNPAYDEIEINIHAYKIDKIKKLLSSEEEDYEALLDKITSVAYEK